MDLSFVNEGEEKYSTIYRPAEPGQQGTTSISPYAEAGKATKPSRLDPQAQITNAMMWHSPDKPTRKKSRSQGPSTGPTWGHLLGQIIIGVVEILIPLAFIVGMIYWRAPWLFWAVVHFLRGEPILNF